MAKEQWKMIGVIVSLTSLLIIVVGIAWTGGGRVTGVEKDIDQVEKDGVEDRKSIEDVTTLVTALKDKQAADYKALNKKAADDYKELKQDANDAKLRDERQSTQYTAILGHMERQTSHNEKAEESISDMKTDIGKIQVQVDTLTKD